MNENCFKTSLSLEDMYNAYVECRKHKRNKRAAKKFEVNALFNLQKLTDEINERKYRLSPSQCFIIDEPVKREVFCATFRDRIIQHFVFNELNPIIEKELIYDCSSCRKGKGTDFAIKRVQRFLRGATDNYKENVCYLKLDLSGFFMRIDRTLLFERVKSLIKEKYKGNYQEILLYLTEIIIMTDVTENAIRLCDKEKWNDLPERKTLFGNKNGLPIGNICSQLFANYYMNDIDHFVKSRHHYYSRYVDDMIVIDSDQSKLKETHALLKEKLERINMSLNNKTIFSHSRYGISYLGVVICPYYSINGKKRIKRIMNSKYKNPEELCRSLNSRKGIFERYCGRNLCKRHFASVDQKISKNVILSADLKAFLIEIEPMNN